MAIDKILNMPTLQNPGKKHLVLKPIVKPNSKLFRQINLEKFEDWLKTKTHYFARLDRFDDLLEGIIGRTSLNSIINDSRFDKKGLDEQYKNWQMDFLEKRQRFFINCWQLKTEPDPRGWDVYTKNNPKAIAIETTYDNLKKSIVGNDENVMLTPVSYVEEDFQDQNRIINPQDYKRKNYSWENEIRCVTFLPYTIDLALSPQEKRIKFNLNELINKIHISPFAENNFIHEIQNMCEKYGVPRCSVVNENSNHFK